jgi:antitoxin component YwqK of YwqJK toxin-antitoxin module
MKMEISIKAFLILALSFCLACNTTNEKSFTNKAEAKNEIKNGLKEGKWFEYMDTNDKVVSDTNALYYRLAIYHAGKLNDTAREYYKNGKIFNIVYYIDDSIYGVKKWYYPDGILQQEDPFTINGKANGLLKGYDGNGCLETEIPYKDNRANGIGKDYYENGKLLKETPYLNDSANGTGKEYYEDGKLKSEITFVNDSAVAAKNYDENGNEIK